MTANQMQKKLAGFTLVELLVSIVIVAILSGLTLSGLSRLRSEAKRSKTSTTVRKLHEIVWPLYSGVCNRRLAGPTVTSYFVPPGTLNSKQQGAWRRRELIRRQQILELPETWNEVADINPANGKYVLPASVATALGVSLTTSLDNLTSPSNFSGPVKAYAARKAKAPPPSPDYASAECLFMIVAFSGDPDILETFHQSEIGDKDGDGAPEFHDGWGKPILFMRWAPGISYTQIQSDDPTTNPDLSDPMNLDTSEHGLVPLIWSGGADDALSDWNGADPGYGFRADNAGWLAAIMAAANGSPSVLFNICTSTNGENVSGMANSADNITNHALPVR
jgi:prepilin-type N-terminal cleavage/methylation domain-containing protein